jgi:hypothetical protein
MVPIALTLDDNFFLHNIVLLKDLNLVFHLFFSCGETKIALVIPPYENLEANIAM